MLVSIDTRYLAQISVTVYPVHSFSCIRLNLVCNSILHTLPSRLLESVTYVGK